MRLGFASSKPLANHHGRSPCISWVSKDTKVIPQVRSRRIETETNEGSSQLVKATDLQRRSIAIQDYGVLSDVELDVFANEEISKEIAIEKFHSEFDAYQKEGFTEKDAHDLAIGRIFSKLADNAPRLKSSQWQQMQALENQEGLERGSLAAARLAIEEKKFSAELVIKFRKYGFGVLEASEFTTLCGGIPEIALKEADEYSRSGFTGWEALAWRKLGLEKTDVANTRSRFKEIDSQEDSQPAKQKQEATWSDKFYESLAQAFSYLQPVSGEAHDTEKERLAAWKRVFPKLQTFSLRLWDKYHFTIREAKAFQNRSIPMVEPTVRGFLRNKTVSAHTQVGFRTRVSEVVFELADGLIKECYFKQDPVKEEGDVFFPDFDKDLNIKAGIPSYQEPRWWGRSLASYLISQRLGAGLVPHTEVGELPGKGIGVFLDKASGIPPIIDLGDQQYLLVDLDWKDPMLRKKLTEAQLFDALTGQVDRTPQNYFVELDENGAFRRLSLIDNEISFGKNVNEPNHIAYGSTVGGNAFRGVQLPAIIDTEMAETYRSFSEEELTKLLETLSFSDDEIAAAQNRLRCIKKHIEVLNTKERIIEPSQWGSEDATTILTQEATKENSYLIRDCCRNPYSTITKRISYETAINSREFSENCVKA